MSFWIILSRACGNTSSPYKSRMPHALAALPGFACSPVTTFSPPGPWIQLARHTSISSDCSQARNLKMRTHVPAADL